MGKNILVEALRASDAERGKKSDGYFDCNASVISYSTGFPVLDYYLGYKVNVCDEEGHFKEGGNHGKDLYDSLYEGRVCQDSHYIQFGLFITETRQEGIGG